MFDIAQIEWLDDEQTVIHVKAESWTWEEAYEACLEVNKLMDTVDHGVHVIYDLMDAPAVPKGSMTNLRRLLALEHENDRLTIFVTQSQFLRMLIDVVEKAFTVRNVPLRYKFVTTMDAAQEYIAAFGGTDSLR